MASTISFGQKIKENQVSQAIKSKFTSAYPQAKNVKWEKEKGNIEAEFSMNGITNSVVFDSNANILEKETEIKIDQLPNEAKAYVTKNYPGQKIKEAAKMVDAKNVIKFEAEIKGADLIFDANGKFIKKVIEKEDKED